MISIDLTGKTAIVTGATGQLGRVICKFLAQAGANVVLQYHNPLKKEFAESLLEEFKKLNVKGTTYRCDVTVLEQVMQMMKDLKEQMFLPDIVVCCAVAQYDWTSVLEQPIEDYDSQYRTCVLHSVNMAKAFIPHMKEMKYGRMIALSTECVMQNFPVQSAYVSGKRGMDGVMRVLAREVGEFGITVNQVAPGDTISDNDRKNGISPYSEYIDKVPLKRRGIDEEVAAAVAFLASDLASFITGAWLPVCGGNVMPCI